MTQTCPSTDVIRARFRGRAAVHFLLAFAAAWAASPRAGSSSVSAAEARRPNILFVFSDDHATEAISAYSGGRLNETPHIDRIAREGMLFRNSFCANSICGPSRACILTGKHSHINGFLDNDNSSFDGSQPTFPKMLQGAGYQTALIGKWHLVSDPTGFDHWEILPGQGSYYNPDFIQMDGSRKRREGYCTDIITDMALDWLKSERDPDKPFVLMCQHKAPHRNWSPPERHFRLFDDRDLPEPATLFDDYANRSKVLAENEMTIARHMYWGHDMKFHGDVQFPDHFLDGIPNGEYRRMSPEQKAAWDAAYEPKNQAFIEAMKAGSLTGEEIVRWKYQRYIKDYLRCIQAVDDGIGRLLAYLDEAGLAENTVVIYSSDQGFYLGEHGWYDKRWMFEESLEMPFVIRWPGVVPAGTTSDALIQNIDYAPTFLEMAGVAIPGDIQGRSLLPALQADGGRVPDGWRDDLYYAYYGERTHNVAAHDGVRTMRHKLMFFPRTREWQLFDLETDPMEMRSVHEDPAYAEILAGMKRRYEEARARYEVNTAVIPAPRITEDWWRQRWQEKQKLTQDGPGTILFVGDSITQGWEGPGKELWAKYYEPRGAINLGFSGDRTEHALWRLDKGRFNGSRPKAAVVMIGTNNTGHLRQEAGQTAAGIGEVVGALRRRFPDTPVLLLGVFPRGETPDDETRRINAAINEHIAALGGEDKVTFLDLGDAFLEDDGTLSKDVMPDFLHLSPEGYRRWAEAMEETLCRIGGFAPVAAP